MKGLQDENNIKSYKIKLKKKTDKIKLKSL